MDGAVSIVGRIAVVLFGLGMVGISLAMWARPDATASRMLRFIRMPFMHPIEILTRVGFGVLFILGAGPSRFPVVLRAFGYLLVAVGLALLFTPPSLHRRFGVWSVERFSRRFRLAAVPSLAFGAFLIYAAV